MRPLTVFTGFVLGSALSIAVSLAAVMVIFLILGDKYPRVDYEFNSLLVSTLLFLTLTAISAASFYALVRGWKSRMWWQGGMWLAVIWTGAYFWP